MIPLMLDEGVESRSDGVHRMMMIMIMNFIHVSMYLAERFHSYWMHEGVESRSDGVHRITCNFI